MGTVGATMPGMMYGRTSVVGKHLPLITFSAVAQKPQAVLSKTPFQLLRLCIDSVVSLKEMYFKTYYSWVWWCSSLIPALRRQREADIVSWRLAWPKASSRTLRATHRETPLGGK